MSTPTTMPLSAAKISDVVTGWLKDIKLIFDVHRHELAKGTLEKIRKADHTYVTRADLEIDQYVCERLEHYFPDHQVMSEERADDFNWNPDNPYLWVMDPIDGTHEFMNTKSNYYGLSLALYYNRQPVFALVYAPHLPQADAESSLYLMHSELPQATLNGKPISVVKNISLDQVRGQINISSANPKYELALTKNYPHFEKHYPRALALHLCEVAASGTFSHACLFTQTTPKFWDMAAAMYIATGAGALVADLKGRTQYPVSFLDVTDHKFRIPSLLVGDEAIVKQVANFLSQNGLN